MNSERVLISCPVSDRKEYCRQDYLRNISNFTYLHKEFYFSDNSPSIKYHIESFLLHGFDCDHISPIGKQNNEYIAESHEQIRRYFLQSNCTHWLSLEEDLFPESDIIEQLLSYNASVVSANYMIGEGAQSRLMQLNFDDSFSINVNRHVSCYESFVSYGTQKPLTQNSFGMGCVLMTKEVASQIQFWVTEDSAVHADLYFSLDLDFLGIPVTYHNQIIEHRNSSWSGISDYKI